MPRIKTTDHIGDELLTKRIVMDWCSTNYAFMKPYDLLWLYDVAYHDVVLLDSPDIQVDIKREKKKIKIQIILQCN